MKRRTRILRRTAALLCTLLMCLNLSGCWQEEDPIPHEESSPLPVQPPEPEPEPVNLPERFALPYDPNQSLDPITCPDGMQQTVCSLICEGLFRLDTHMEPQAALCESWRYEPSNKAWTFVLRPGVAFSDGVPLTAAHVKASLERARQSERYRDRLRQISWITAEGDTLFIGLYAHNTGLPALLDVPVVRMDGQTPVGTGPYRFSAYGAYLVPNEHWRQGGGQPVERIYLEDSADALLYRFTSGDVHLIVTDLTVGPPSGITGDIRYRDAATASFQYIALNTARRPLSSAPFRRALDLGVDRAGLTSTLLSGHARPAQFPVSPASSLYPAALDRTYSSAAFAEAVAECGVEPERTLSLLVNEENTFKVSVARAIARNYTAAGIPVEVRALPWEDYLWALENRNFDLCYCEGRLTADWNLSSLLQSWGALNAGGWDSAETARLLEQYAAAEDRAAAMEELCEHLREQAPILPICFSNSSVLMHAEVVENLIPTAAEPFYNLTECRVHLRESAQSPE